MKIKLRSFNSIKNINEKGGGPYRGFGYLSFFSDNMEPKRIRKKKKNNSGKMPEKKMGR